MIELRLPASLLQRLPSTKQASHDLVNTDDDEDDVYFCGNAHSNAAGQNPTEAGHRGVGQRLRSMQQQLRNVSLVCKKWHQFTQKAPFHILWQSVCLQGVRHAHAAVLALCTANHAPGSSARSRFKSARRPMSWHASDNGTPKDITTRLIITFDGTGCIGLTDDAVGSLCACVREQDEEESSFSASIRANATAAAQTNLTQTQHLISSKAGLRHVSLVGCTYISDVSLSHLAQHSSSLGL